ETAWKRYSTILVSDAGGKLAPEPDPKADWVQHSVRVMGLIDNQVRSLRKRQLIGAYATGRRAGAYWGIRSDVAHYRVPDALPCPHGKTLRLAAVATRLEAMRPLLQKRLINWGYAVCDAAMRRHVDPTLAPPAGFPYPSAGVG
ncbi:MAG TPA: patatin-like phospholipase family protein, partial [Thermoanaerobaculia bacterium]|nr:patatin-like phospholipase family protein [Thermoanaerobaculia bacterium]